MKVVFDTSVLLLLVDPEAKPTTPSSDVKDEAGAQERLDYLVAKLEKQRATIAVPTPVLSELLASLGAVVGGITTVLATATRRFTIAPFDTIAAVECGQMLAEATGKGKRRSVDAKNVPWSKIKFDHQIVAIAKVLGAETIYSDDRHVRALGKKAGIAVYGVWDLPAPPIDPQRALPLPEPTSA